MSNGEAPLVGIEDVRAAAGRLAGVAVRTPLIPFGPVAERRYLKAESLQPIGAFKIRGAYNAVALLSADERARGVITYSSGNHAQGVARAARLLGVAAVVVMPSDAPAIKRDRVAADGAEVVVVGTASDERRTVAEQLAAERGLAVIPPFDDDRVIAGHGSAGLEILEDLPDLDVLVIGIGGGGLISGVAAAVKQQRPQVRIYGIEPEGSDAISQALAAGEPVRIQPRSVADGLNAPFAGELTLAMIQRYVDDVIRIDDATILAGLRFAIERMKQVLEPAGAAALAATLAGHIPIREGERVAVLLSGGNVDVARLGELVAAAGPLPG